MCKKSGLFLINYLLLELIKCDQLLSFSSTDGIYLFIFI